MLRTSILHINNSKNFNKLVRKIVQQKTGNVTFFSQNLFFYLSEWIWMFSDFFSNFWKPRFSKNVWVVLANRYDRLSRNFLSVVRSLFAKTYRNLVIVFSKLKKKISNIRKKSEKIHLYSNKLTNQFWL